MAQPPSLLGRSYWPTLAGLALTPPVSFQSRALGGHVLVPPAGWFSWKSSVIRSGPSVTGWHPSPANSHSQTLSQAQPTAPDPAHWDPAHRVLAFLPHPVPGLWHRDPQVPGQALLQKTPHQAPGGLGTPANAPSHSPLRLSQPSPTMAWGSSHPSQHPHSQSSCLTGHPQSLLPK